VRPRRETSKSAASPKSWAYLGSANCSESAWGKLTKDRVSKCPKLNCRNWECGVLIPAQVQTGEECVDGVEGNELVDTLAEFEGVVPVPMHYPGTEYGDRKPWYFTEQRY